MSRSELLQRAAKERASLRMGNLPEDERERMEAKLDFLAPFRNLVLGLGAIFFFAGFVDVFFALVERKELDNGLVTVLLFEALAGGGLLYAGFVLMAPASLPTLDELLEDQEALEVAAQAPPAPLKKRGSMIGRWSYGLFNNQEFVLDRDESGTWLFTEELGGQRYSGILSPQGRWLQGAVHDDETGEITGTIRLRPGPNDTALTCFQQVGESEWSAELVASLVSRLVKDVPKQPTVATREGASKP